MAAEQKQMQAPCSLCRRRTWHNILHSVHRAGKGEPYDDYFFLECAGCRTVSMANICQTAEDEDTTYYYETYYPSPVSRQMPKWMFHWSLISFSDEVEQGIGRLLGEVYQAIRGGQVRLAVMGIRAALEQVMIHKVGDQGTFGKNLDEFCAQGYASKVQRDHLKTILDAGHAVMHRSFRPSDDDLDTALDVTEGIIAAIYVHPSAAEKLAGRVPPRPPRLKKEGGQADGGS